MSKSKKLLTVSAALFPQRCHNAKAMVRYMAHLDNPEKAQYDVADIKDMVVDAEMLAPLPSSIREMFPSLYICDLKHGAAAERFDDWFPLLCDNSAYVVGQYIKSQRHSAPVLVDLRQAKFLT